MEIAPERGRRSGSHESAGTAHSQQSREASGSEGWHLGSNNPAFPSSSQTGRARRRTSRARRPARALKRFLPASGFSHELNTRVHTPQTTNPGVTLSDPRGRLSQDFLSTHSRTQSCEEGLARL